MLLSRYFIPLLCIALPTIAQQSAAPPPAAAANQPQPTFRVNSTLVLVDVVATDHHGRAISDLKPEELRLLEDGKERPIKSLTLDRADANAAANLKLAQGIKATLAKLPRNVSTNLAALGSVPNGVASTVILMDALNTQFAARAYARQQMLQLLKKLDTKQPVAVYGLTNSLHLLQDFTTDPAVIQAAIARNGNQGSLLGVGEGDLIDHSGSDTMSDLVPDAVYERVRQFESESSAQLLDLRIQHTLDALQSIGRRLQSVPGRKNLIWLSGSFPLDLYPDNDYSSISVRHYADKLIATLNVLENARISIYPVSADGLAGDPTFNADRDPTGLQRRGPGAIADASRQWFQQNSSTHDTMRLMAEKTGGLAFYNSNNLKDAVQSAIEDGGAYYSLAFTPAKQEADGRLHQLKLTTTRKGLELRYRRGYVSLDNDLPSKQRLQFMRDELSNALTDTQQLSTGVLFYAQPGQDGKTIDLLVDPRFLTFSEGDNGMVRLQFQVATATFDKKGKVLKSGTDVVGKDLKREQIQALLASGAHFAAPVERTEGATRVRIAVRDLPTDRIGTVDVKLD